MDLLRSLGLAAAVLLFTVSVQADDFVRVGAGSYATRTPEGAKRPQQTVYRSKDLQGPMPTNRWWSSLAWMPLSEPMYPHPLAVQAVEGGVRVAYPGAHITANSAAIMGPMASGGDDFVVGLVGAMKFTEARVDGHSDWFVSALFEEGQNRLRASFGHGSPFVFCTLNGNPTLTFKAAPKVWSGSAQDAVVGFSVGKRHYAAFAPRGTTWLGLKGEKWTADTHGKDYFTVAVLPDNKPETLELFRNYAYSHVIDTQVAWKYDESRCAVKTTFTFTTRTYEGTAVGTLFALYPHQWTRTSSKLLDLTYNSVRGPMMVGVGPSFITDMTYPGVLPSLPLVAGLDRKKLSSFIADELNSSPPAMADTYWMGKQLGKWATLIPIAEQLGDTAAVETISQRTRTTLENFFTATNATNQLKKASNGVFFYDANWSTLIGYPASFGSDDQLNDHHFHYGYFIRAAGELARRDPAWAADGQWGGMVRMLARDIASPDREDSLFPFLRTFDPYAGHSWASGHSKFADGNNNESSSEAINAWYGLILFGEATSDRALRDLGVWLLTTEIEAINDYWFDVENQYHHSGFSPSVVTMVWGGKGANGTWFSANPEMVHGINWLPLTGASLYLGRYPEYCAKNYEALVEENKADDLRKPANAGKPAASITGTQWDAWADLVWMYRACSDPQDALKQFHARPQNFKPEEGNSLANTYVWLMAFDKLGEVEREISANCLFYAVFNKQGQRTYIAWNMSDMPLAVTFSDGTRLTCPPKSFLLK
ncbi:MAG: glycoside hydrolase family 81 [Planctomycetaceae bacterium]|nr:glycoside hydrolase family 81 [Planctomycetaceae bacterium]